MELFETSHADLVLVVVLISGLNYCLVVLVGVVAAVVAVLEFEVDVVVVQMVLLVGCLIVVGMVGALFGFDCG